MSYAGRKWMLFVDGENFTIQGQKKASELNLSLKDRILEETVFSGCQMHAQ
jgi:hypothetical protein